MAGRYSQRLMTLETLRHRNDSHVPIVRCLRCGHQAPLPLERLIRKHGPEFAVEFADGTMRCQRCQTLGGKILVARLCDPGCAKQRG